VWVKWIETNLCSSEQAEFRRKHKRVDSTVETLTAALHFPAHTGEVVKCTTGLRLKGVYF
jgi:hypothetical protein